MKPPTLGSRVLGVLASRPADAFKVHDVAEALGMADLPTVKGRHGAANAIGVALRNLRKAGHADTFDGMGDHGAIVHWWKVTDAGFVESMRTPPQLDLFDELGKGGAST